MRSTIGILGLLTLAFGLLLPSTGWAQCPGGKCAIPAASSPVPMLSPDGSKLVYSDGTVFVRGSDGVYRKGEKKPTLYCKCVGGCGCCGCNGEK